MREPLLFEYYPIFRSRSRKIKNGPAQATLVSGQASLIVVQALAVAEQALAVAGKALAVA